MPDVRDWSPGSFQADHGDLNSHVNLNRTVVGHAYRGTFGAGSWGTTVASPLARQERLHVLSATAELAREISNATPTSGAYLPGFAAPVQPEGPPRTWRRRCTTSTFSWSGVPTHGFPGHPDRRPPVLRP